MEQELSNKQLYEELSQYVVNKFFDEEISSKFIERGPLEILSFSNCFWVSSNASQHRRGVYVKIPQIVFCKTDTEKIMPFSDDDRKLAEDEYRSLVHLSQNWKNDDIGVRFVRPLEFLREHNAIITERFYADHFFELFRKVDLRERIGIRSNDSIHRVMSRLGQSLSRFHQTSIAECEFDADRIIEKVATCCGELSAFGISKEFMKLVKNKLNLIGNYKLYTHQTNTLKGFDVRQVFIDKDETIFMLDPGKMKPDYKEMDLARFIVTCRILYWGSLLFFFRLIPGKSYEEDFVAAYYGINRRSEEILHVLIIKELLKHWRMAYTALEVKQWPSLIKELLKKTYIDPFYRWQIKSELVKLES